MAFVVSARKYRPARFDEVVGQEHVSQTLKNALKSDHLAHAFLFCGPRGVGKTTCARILAKVLNCQNRTDDFEACNTCSSCTAFNESASFNITELDAASNNSVEHIRALIEQVRFQPQQGKYKVYIIDEVHMLSQQAFNAFLKTLEEPPPYAIFILATTEKHKIIPTILSRCQIFDFNRIQIPSMVSHLQNICEQEAIEADKDALHIIAQKADGALRDALSIFDRIVSFSGKSIQYDDVITNLNVLDYDYFFKIVEALLVEDISGVLLTFDEILKKGFDSNIFINGLAEHLRNILVCKDEATLKLLEVGDALKVRYKQQAQLAPASLLLAALNISNDCDVQYKLARNKRLHVEMAIIKMCYIHRATKFVEVPVQQRIVTNTSAAPQTSPQKKNSEPKLTPSTTTRNEVQEEKIPLEKPKKLSAIKKKLKSTGFSLKNIEEAVKKESVANAADASLLTQENVQKAWKTFTENIKSQSTRAIMRTVTPTLENGLIKAKVGSALAKNSIGQEAELMSFLRKELKSPMVVMEIDIDKSLVVEKIEKPKAPSFMSDKEKYKHLSSQNNALGELQKRFDLRLDRS